MALLHALGVGTTAHSTLGGKPGVITLENTLRIPCPQTVLQLEWEVHIAPGLLVTPQRSKSSIENRVSHCSFGRCLAPGRSSVDMKMKG